MKYTAIQMFVRLLTFYELDILKKDCPPLREAISGVTSSTLHLSILIIYSTKMFFEIMLMLCRN